MTYDELCTFTLLRKTGRWIGACASTLSLAGWAAILLGELLSTAVGVDSIAMAFLAMGVASMALVGSLRDRASWLLMAGSYGFVSAGALTEVAEPLRFVGFLAVGYLVAAMLMWRPGAMDTGWHRSERRHS